MYKSLGSICLFGGWEQYAIYDVDDPVRSDDVGKYYLHAVVEGNAIVTYADGYIDALQSWRRI